ncbi:MAG: hypothetical protein K2N85_07280 [Lachnospiraceae bacterium]|nr:hypothetical protein [Lachnospiraceae bacterium]
MKKSMGIFTKIYLVALHVSTIDCQHMDCNVCSSKRLAVNAENNLQDMAEEIDTT